MHDNNFMVKFIFCSFNIIKRGYEKDEQKKEGLNGENFVYMI